MGTGVGWTMNSMVHPTPVPKGPSVKRKTEMNYAKFISVVPFYFSRAASFA